MQNPKKKLSKLEAMRGFAAVYVVLHHVFRKGLHIGVRDFSFLFRFGQEAVILFFLLSGFVIQYSYTLSKDKSFKAFFLKRFFRVYIPLVIVFIANYLIISIAKHALVVINWPTLAGNILMLQDAASLKPNVICSPFLGNTPLWSLSYEWWFYVIFFFVMIAVKQKASLIVYIAGVVSALTYLTYPNFLNRELMYLVIWWTGVDMAILYINNLKITVAMLKAPLIALILIIIILAFNVKLKNSHSTIGVSPFLELRHFAFAFTTILVALLWQKFKWIGFKYTLGLFEPIAAISFGIYIAHWFLIVNAHYLDQIVTNIYVRYFAYATICILFSYVTERIIYVRLNKYLWKKINLSR
ncbi:MAG: acyltransferase [Mucilaginibacter sp.]|nr:acyltransferase [Mucilaginibacter sp.]